MSETRWTEVDDYVSALFGLEDDALSAAVRDSVAAGLPPYQVSAAQGKLLQLLARGIGAQRVLEVGTLGGYSTIWLARAVALAGDTGASRPVVTLELNPEFAEVAARNVARAGLERVVEIRVGPALQTLPLLAREGGEPFDFVFVDADKGNNTRYVEWALELARPGALIVIDNVVRGGAVVDADSSDPSVCGVRAMNEFLARERRLSATTIQTVGSKGYDGFTLAYVVG